MQNNLSDKLNKPVQYVKSVGEARAKLFHKLNIFTIEDLVTFFPRQYEDRTSLKRIIELEDNEACAFEGTISSSVSENRIRKGLTVSKVIIKDETGAIAAVWFNQNYIRNIFKIGEKYVFYGKITRKFGTFEIANPIYEKIAEDRELKNTCRIVPVYRSTAKLTQNAIRTAIRNALDMAGGHFEDMLPEGIRKQYLLSEINYCIENIHFPKSDEDFKNARYRLVFEEFIMLQLGLLRIKASLQEGRTGIKFSREEDMESFIKSLPFRLTEAQINVFREIQEDMESHKIMNRLIQGDVGSGKTVVAAMALFKAVKNGYQGTLMVPTEILAEQHFQSLNQLMLPFGVRVGLLTGSLTQKQKRELLGAVEKGEIDILVGTHALIEDAVKFMRLGLVITDEQHRFGVSQRALLSQKGCNPDVIVMTATPIPRTLALILYGDLDISIINQLPPGRKPIKTYTVDNNMRERINKFIKEKVREGRQAYIVCPLVEESEAVDAKAAADLAERLASEDFRDMQVGLMHGKMKPKDKDEVMKAFVEGKINILVSTTVIEVGVNVPNSTVMVVENAERFGLAQLHQLRGRVGRGGHQSYCILFNESKSAVSKERMKVMEKTNDGFIISEKDLELRGPGEFFGTRQHGLPEFKIANIYKDMDILKAAQEAARDILKEDPLLEDIKNEKIRQNIDKTFETAYKRLSFT